MFLDEVVTYIHKFALSRNHRNIMIKSTWLLDLRQLRHLNLWGIYLIYISMYVAVILYKTPFTFRVAVGLKNGAVF